MEYLKIFWDEVVAMDPSAEELDEGVRFPMCKPEALELIFQAAGMKEVKSSAIEMPVRFETFSDYWQPFLGRTGPAPLYVASLNSEKRAELQDRLKKRLIIEIKGGIKLVARAWARSWSNSMIRNECRTTALTRYLSESTSNRLLVILWVSGSVAGVK